jgi:hypothetical protein
MGQPIPIRLPPGMSRNATRYETAGRWYNGNLVRWENGRIKPIGGWQQSQSGLLKGIARGGLAFADDLGFRQTLIGTNSNLYLSQGGTFSDVTPTDFLTGRVDSILGAGYGAGKYGTGHYGTRRTATTLLLSATTWQMDTFGATGVMVSTSDRRLRQYDPGTGLVTIPAGSPICAGVFTTNEDFCMLIGAGGVGRKIQWPDIGTTTVWTPSDINSAGDINLNTQGLGVAGTRVGLNNLVWTTVDVHLVNYVGQPAIYAPIRIGTACGLIGPRAWAVAATGAGAGEAAYWMSPGGFFQYTGTVTPLPCEVQDFLWRNINFTQAAKIYASTNSLKHEVVWFFPSLNSIEVDSYVMYNYKDNLWYFGIASSLARTTYIDLGANPLPIGIDATGAIYQHETGYLANGASRVGQVFVASGLIEIGDGDQTMYANMLWLDGDNLLDPTGANVLTLSPRSSATPLAPVYVSAAIPLVPNAEGYTPCRFSGREIALRFDIVKDQDWSLGKLRFVAVAGSKR